MFVMFALTVLSGKAFAHGQAPANFSCRITDFENPGHGNVLLPTNFQVEDDKLMTVVVYDQKKFIVRYSNLTAPSDSTPNYELSLSVRDAKTDQFMFGSVEPYSTEIPALRLLAGGGIVFSCTEIN